MGYNLEGIAELANSGSFVAADTGHRLGKKANWMGSLKGVRSDKGRLTGSCWTSLAWQSSSYLYPLSNQLGPEKVGWLTGPVDWRAFHQDQWLVQEFLFNQLP